MKELNQQSRVRRSPRRIRVPPMLTALVQAGFLSVDTRVFSQCAACPACGGPVFGYDSKERKFATIREGDTVHDIMVTVRRFRCRQCGKISPARAPFYPDTRLGSPVVDLCVVLSRSMTPGRAAAFMESLGILVDRGTVRNLASRDVGEIATTEIFGFTLPRSLLSLSMVAFRDLQEGG